MKLCILILLISSSMGTFAQSSPNEEKIFFHIHQATRWAELHYSKKLNISNVQIEKFKIKHPENWKEEFTLYESI